MLASTLLNVVLPGSCSSVAAELLNTAWLINDGEPQGSLQNISGGLSDSTRRAYRRIVDVANSAGL